MTLRDLQLLIYQSFKGSVCTCYTLCIVGSHKRWRLISIRWSKCFFSLHLINTMIKGDEMNSRFFCEIIWFLIAIFHYDPYLKLVFSATKIKFTFIIETTINGKQIRKYWMVWNLPKPCNWPNTSSFDFLSKFSTFILVILIIYSLCLVHWQVHQLKMFQYYERQLCYCCRHHAQLKPAQY